MEKVRVYTISKKLEVTNSEVIAVLRSLGAEVKSHSSSVTADIAGKAEKVIRKGVRKESAPEEASKAVKAMEKAQPSRRPASDKVAEKTVKPAAAAAETPSKERPVAAPEEEVKTDKLKTRSMKRAFDAIKKVGQKKPAAQFRHGRGAARGRAARPGVVEPQVEAEHVSTAAPRKKAIKLPEIVTVKEFSELIGQKVAVVIKKLMELGSMVTINQPIDMDAAILIADGFGIKVEPAPVEEVSSAIREEEDRPEDLSPRAPVVTVMGHVDHGKTSLLDVIRKTRVTDQESGGITQHIGAYKVGINGKNIVFLDTPGHEAFTTMRARGAQATDIVVLVVAADDGVMPQTVEAIDHARAADVPVIVAVNKMDKPEANPQRVRSELSEHDIVSEEWGGKNIFVEVSAMEKTGIDDLLEMIALQAEVLELKANPKRPSKGVIIESRLDRGRGPVATVLVQTGTLKVGDVFVSGSTYGRVRALINDNGKRVSEVKPSTPVEIIGFSDVPQAGDTFNSIADEKKARQVAMDRQHRERLAVIARANKIKLDELHTQIEKGEVKELNIIIKADVQGSVEALKGSLEKIEHPQVQVRVIHTGVGGINESDVMLASASNAIIIGFNVRPEAKATKASEEESVDIELYSVIYEAIEDVKKALAGLLAPTIEENVVGKAEVRETFTASRIGTIAGCYVVEGHIQRASDGIRVIRDNIVVYEGKIASLKRFKEDVREVQSGYECGILVENFNDIKVGDVLENFITKEIAATL